MLEACTVWLREDVADIEAVLREWNVASGEGYGLADVVCLA